MLQTDALFRREQIGHADLRFACEEFLCFCEQRLGNLAREVGVATILIGEGIEDAEACWPCLLGARMKTNAFRVTRRSMAITDFPDWIVGRLQRY